MFKLKDNICFFVNYFYFFFGVIFVLDFFYFIGLELILVMLCVKWILYLRG